MTVAIIIGGIAFVVVLLVLGRNSSRMRKEAKEDLERQKEELKPPDILELVRQEAEESGVLEIPGADDVDLTVRLRAFQRDREVADNCAAGVLRFVVDDDVRPEVASVDDVRLECDGSVPDAGGTQSDPAEDP